MCVCVFSSHSFWTSSSLDVPAGITQEEGHTGFFIHHTIYKYCRSMADTLPLPPNSLPSSVSPPSFFRGLSRAVRTHHHHIPSWPVQRLGGGGGCNKYVPLLGGNGTKIVPSGDIFDQPPGQMRWIRGKLADHVGDHVVVSPEGAVLVTFPGTKSSYPHPSLPASEVETFWSPSTTTACSLGHRSCECRSACWLPRGPPTSIASLFYCIF